MQGIISGVIALSPIAFAAAAPDSDPSTTSALTWIAGAAAAAVIFNQVSEAWGRMTGKFSQDESPVGGYRGRHDCIEIHKALNTNREKCREKLEASDHDLRLEIKDDIEGMHRRLDAVLIAVTTLTETVIKKVGD